MAPIATQDLNFPRVEEVKDFKTALKSPVTVPVLGRQPLALGNALDEYKFFELTQTIGRQYKDVQISDIIHSPDADAKLRDLGVVLAQRGVVVFPGQKLSPGDQKTLVQRMGELTGKPKSSGLHVHPINHTTHELGGPTDPHMSTIARNPDNMLSKQRGVSGKKVKIQSTADGWHHDIGFERVTSDYSSLYMRTVPPTGGDTLFASAYEVYDRISEHYQKFLETLTCTFMPVGYEPNPEHEHLYQVERGSPLNVDQSLTAVHPVVRTNPVTGWKTVFAVGHHAQFINELTPLESERTLDFLNNLISKNHDLQVRFKWNVDDLVLWDNRAVYHTATYDYSAPRAAHRVVSVGEAPALLQGSVSRTEALGL